MPEMKSVFGQKDQVDAVPKEVVEQFKKAHQELEKLMNLMEDPNLTWGEISDADRSFENVSQALDSLVEAGNAMNIS